MNRKIILSLYAWIVAATGFFLLFIKSGQISWPTVGLIFLFILLQILVEWVHVPMRGGIVITVDFVLIYFIFLYFGSLPAAWVVALGSLFHQFRRKKPIQRAFFVGGQFVIATFLMGYLFNLLQGICGKDVLQWRNIFPLFIGVLTYVLTNDIFVDIYALIEGGTRWEELWETTTTDLLTNLALAPISVISVYLFSRLGVVGGIWLILPLLLMGWAILTLLKVRAKEKVSLQSQLLAVTSLVLFFSLFVSLTAVTLHFAKGSSRILEVAGISPFALIGTINDALMVAVGFFLLSFLLAVGIIREFVRRRITKPLNSVVAILEDMAKGEADISTRIEVPSADEIGTLAENFNEFMGKLEDIVMAVSNTASGVASTSEELAASAEEMNASQEEIASTTQKISQGTATQSTAVKETIQSIAEITNSVNEINTKAKDSVTATQEASQMAKRGGEAVIEVVERMQEIDQSMLDLSTLVEKLNSNSTQIGGIVDLISSIAWRTNLLALNAAIEAARAGEVGRGFSVVASEVKKLAERSSKAAKEITSLIREIQNETQLTVESTKDRMTKVKEGREKAESAGKALGEIISVVDKVSGMAQGISQSSNREVEQTQKIVKAVEKIATVAEETATGMEQSAAAQEEQTASMQEMTASAQELAKAAEKLKSLVEKFKISPK
ncbi:MAG: methyl-accepting chemotaxis protein [Candidatus Edwardsbacteria bacterium]